MKGDAKRLVHEPRRKQHLADVSLSVFVFLLFFFSSTGCVKNEQTKTLVNMAILLLNVLFI